MTTWAFNRKLYLASSILSVNKGDYIEADSSSLLDSTAYCSRLFVLNSYTPGPYSPTLENYLETATVLDRDSTFAAMSNVYTIHEISFAGDFQDKKLLIMPSSGFSGGHLAVSLVAQPISENALGRGKREISNTLPTNNFSIPSGYVVRAPTAEVSPSLYSEALNMLSGICKNGLVMSRSELLTWGGVTASFNKRLEQRRFTAFNVFANSIGHDVVVKHDSPYSSLIPFEDMKVEYSEHSSGARQYHIVSPSYSANTVSTAKNLYVEYKKFYKLRAVSKIQYIEDLKSYMEPSISLAQLGTLYQIEKDNDARYTSLTTDTVHAMEISNGSVFFNTTPVNAVNMENYIQVSIHLVYFSNVLKTTAELGHDPYSLPAWVSNEAVINPTSPNFARTAETRMVSTMGAVPFLLFYDNTNNRTIFAKSLNNIGGMEVASAVEDYSNLHKTDYSHHLCYHLSDGTTMTYQPKSGRRQLILGDTQFGISSLSARMSNYLRSNMGELVRKAIADGAIPDFPVLAPLDAIPNDNPSRSITIRPYTYVGNLLLAFDKVSITPGRTLSLLSESQPSKGDGVPRVGNNNYTAYNVKFSVYANSVSASNLLSDNATSIVIPANAIALGINKYIVVPRGESSIKVYGANLEINLK